MKGVFRVKEYIEREALLKLQYNSSEMANVLFENMVVDVRDIENATAADVVEVRHGEWLHTDKAFSWHSKDECSECHYHNAHRIDLSYYNYCPNCGADMRGGKNGNEVKECGELKDGDGQ